MAPLAGWYGSFMNDRAPNVRVDRGARFQPILIHRDRTKFDAKHPDSSRLRSNPDMSGFDNIEAKLQRRFCEISDRGELHWELVQRLPHINYVSTTVVKHQTGEGLL
jgi:hypothetical protein